MSSNSPKAVVMEPQSKDDRNDVKAVEIPLPPPEMWAVLDNSTEKTSSSSAAGSISPKLVRRDIEKLTFVGNQPSKAVPLQYSFEHPALGFVDVITVRRLSVGEVGDMLDERPDNMPDFFDIYERMTGIPAPVLRGLVDVDGEAVTGVCFDFLPRLYRPILSDALSSTSTTGEV